MAEYKLEKAASRKTSLSFAQISRLRSLKSLFKTMAEVSITYSNLASLSTITVSKSSATLNSVSSRNFLISEL